MARTITLPDVDDDEQRTLNHLLEQLDKKAGRNRLRSLYYDMKHLSRLVGSVIPPQYMRLGLVLGWSGKAVDVLARRCKLDRFVWTDGDLDSLGYREIFEGNNLGSEVSQGAISSLIHATSFVVNTLGDESTEPAALIHFKDALNATGDWNTRTRRLDDLLSITARKDNEVTGLALYLDGVTIVAERDSSGWSVDRQTHGWGVPADPLPYKPRLGRPFGSSRISRAAMAMQDAATRTVIRMEAHGDIYAIPDLWMLGADMSIFKNADGSTKSAMQVMMGRIKGVPDDEDQRDTDLARVDVKQFQASSPQPHIDALKTQAAQFAGMLDLPVTALGIQAEVNTSTADGSDNAERQLIAEAEGTTDDWRPPLRRAMVRALAMANGIKSTEIPSSWLTIDPKWRPPQYLSRAAQADAGMKQLTAAPWLAETEVGLELLGLTDQQIERALADRRRAAGRSVVDQLTATADASAS